MKIWQLIVLEISLILMTTILVIFLLRSSDKNTRIYIIPDKISDKIPTYEPLNSLAGDERRNFDSTLKKYRKRALRK